MMIVCQLRTFDDDKLTEMISEVKEKSESETICTERYSPATASPEIIICLYVFTAVTAIGIVVIIIQR